MTYLFRHLFRSGLLLVMVAGVLVVAPDPASAGFGVTPPYVRNSELTRNSIYEQRIMLVRGNPNIDLRAEVSVSVPPEIEDWITVEPGLDFVLPAGENRVPMVVRIEVPNRARFDDYSGIIRVRTSPVHDSDRGGGAVSIALGAQISLNISVIDRVIEKFEVRRIRVSNLNVGRQVWWLEYPGKIRFSMALSNTGNVPIAPSLVELDIYNSRGDRLLEQVKHTNRIVKVKPFDTQEVVAHLPTFLPVGNYRAQFRIYNRDEVVRSGEVTFNIYPEGTIEGDNGYGFMGLSLWHKFTIVGPLVLLVLLVVVPTFTFSAKARRSVRFIYLSLIRVIWRFLRLIKSVFNLLLRPGQWFLRRR